MGLGAIVMRSAQTYRAIQLAGAIYLIVVGITMLRSINHKRTKPVADAVPLFWRFMIAK